ncbi:MAG: fimbrillin family protein, partial [Prevotellaceae bacterium]|nr:fimbrillin family protein [Prevotellaceae bacterium]
GLALFAACDRSDETPTGENAGLPLQIRVSAGSFASDSPETRATEAGYVTSFTDGDRIGITVVNSSNAIVQDNVQYVYNSAAGCFVAASGNVYALAGASYLAYYPYAAAMNGKKTPADIVAAFTPKPNQSAYGDYTASDLLTGYGTVSGSTLNIPFTHALSLLEISLPKQKYSFQSGDYEANVADPVFTIAGGTIPYMDAANSVYRCIVKPGNISISGSYRTSAQTINWSKTLTMTAGKYKRLNVNHAGSGTAISVTASATFALGDYYPVANEPACAIGVVFQISNGGANGKIIALNESPTPLQYCSVDNYYWNYWSVDDGSANQAAVPDLNYFPAYKYCHDYAVRYTDWYLPSFNECTSIYSQLSVINGKIARIACAYIITGERYWTSSHVNNYSNGYCIDFSNESQIFTDLPLSRKVRAARNF